MQDVLGGLGVSFCLWRVPLAGDLDVVLAKTAALSWQCSSSLRNSSSLEDCMLRIVKGRIHFPVFRYAPV